MMRINDQKQFFAGVLFLAIGIIALWKLPRPLGTAAAMGPGYFPMLLGIGLVLVGVASMAAGARAGAVQRVEHLPMLPMCCVLGGVVGFGLLIADWGLALSLFLLVAASCYARLLKRPLEVLVMYLVLLPMIWGIFLYTIQLPISVY
jgi:hypothetical protein